jgi:hypothetical protein
MRYSMTVNQAFYPGLVFTFYTRPLGPSRLFVGARTASSSIDYKMGETAVKWNDRLIYWIPMPQVKDVYPVFSQDLSCRNMPTLITSSLCLSGEVRRTCGTC